MILKLLLLLIQIPRTLQFYEEKELNVASPFGGSLVVDERTVFVPLGHPGEFKCIAYEKFKHFNVKNVQWDIQKKKDDGSEEVSMRKAQQWNKTADQLARFVYSKEHDYTLYGLALQKVHDNAVLGCHITVRDPKDHTKEQKVRSWVHIRIQDCGEDDELKFKNVMNPCRYGSCGVEKDHGFEKLTCYCVEQYTGPFCEQEVQGNTWRQLLFYSPIIAHFVLFFGLLFVRACYHKLNRVRRFSLESQIVPKEIAQLDLRTAFPPVYLTKAEIEATKAKIVKDIHNNNNNNNNHPDEEKKTQ